MLQRSWISLIAALVLVCGCVLYRRAGPPDGLPPVEAPPLPERVPSPPPPAEVDRRQPIDTHRLIGLRSSDAVRYASDRGWQCRMRDPEVQVAIPMSEASRPRLRGADGRPLRILITVRDGRVVDAVIGEEIR